MRGIQPADEKDPSVAPLLNPPDPVASGSKGCTIPSLHTSCHQSRLAHASFPWRLLVFLAMICNIACLRPEGLWRTPGLRPPAFGWVLWTMTRHTSAKATDILPAVLGPALSRRGTLHTVCTCGTLHTVCTCNNTIPPHSLGERQHVIASSKTCLVTKCRAVCWPKVGPVRYLKLLQNRGRGVIRSTFFVNACSV